MAPYPSQSSLKVACTLIACALMGVLGAGEALATPSVTSTATTLGALKAEEAALRQILEQTRLDLEIEVASYVETSKLIERTKTEIAQATIDLAQKEIELDNSERALSGRAIELYRGERLDMLDVLFSSSSFEDLWVRASYLTRITSRDARLITGVRLARSEALWLRENLLSKMDHLNELRRDADERRVRIEAELEAQQARAARLAVDLARLMWAPGGGSLAPQGGFNPDTVIAEATFRDSSSMTVEQIQAFLEEQPGTLATYRARDHAGKVKPASQIIADAAQAWGVNPKVILVKLQKEQSLLGRRNPTQNAYDWAMGCGKTDSRTFVQFKGFGQQIWSGADKLANNGRRWRPGISMPINGSTVHPTNAATYSLFKYTPHFRGTMSFWLLYWRYFGDPSV